jgi:diguanylate cyclase (GGDEF)-like protein
MSWRVRRREAHQRDQLTGLAGRAWILDFLENALKDAGSAGQQVAVLLIDLDGLHDINDGFGHDVGDQILVATGTRLEEALRTEDTPARLGGDNFLVVMRGSQPDRPAQKLAARLGELLAHPVAVNGHVHRIKVSIGVAEADGTGTAAEELIRRAAVAMHQAKLASDTRFMAFETWMHDDARRRIELAVDLNGVLESGELILLYQPVVDLHRASVVGAEALVRWQHPTRGLLGPSEFIPLAESDGQILDIGRWVLAEACRHAGDWGWGDAGPEGPFISVNVSARQMTDPVFPADVDAILREIGVEPTTLVLEITESTVMKDSAAVLQRVHELKELGVRIALDDYGTGYSSMSRLLAFPVDVLKIDRVFVAPASRGDPTALALVRSMVSLCDELGMRAIAEGIETQREATQMRACGFRYGQGYLLGRPVPAEVFGVLRHARQIDEQVGLPQFKSPKRRRPRPHPPSDHPFPADAV